MMSDLNIKRENNWYENTKWDSVSEMRSEITHSLICIMNIEWPDWDD